MTKTELCLTVNGKSVSRMVEPRLTLVDFLRDMLALTGTHIGCEHGVCGACSILLDGVPIRSCLMLAVQAAGKSVTTVEGLSNADGSTGLLQDAFQDAHALQCGYCTPGMLVSAQALLDQSVSVPDVAQIKEAIGGNLCRCTGYVQIIEAIQLAATRKFGAGL